MSNGRSTFILTGGGLLTLAMLGFTAREFRLGPFAAELASWSPLVAYGAMGSAALIGGLLLVFAPSSRRVEHRVRLDRHDAANPVMARPAAAASAPTTVGLGRDAEPARGADSKQHSKHGGAVAAGHAAPPAMHANGMDPPAGSVTQHHRDGNGGGAKHRPRSWAHPNDVGENAPSPARQASHSAADPQRAPKDAESLRARLAELDRQANHAKVRYGLGQLSATGYGQVLAKLNEARARIEEALLDDLEV